jgi:hypothetical protein
MHEINAAAETITNAADPSANVIFGAAIDPTIDGEVIVTVVATGFDASYFTKRQGGEAALGARHATNPAPVVSTATKAIPAEEEMTDLDMSLDQGKDIVDLNSDEQMPNIWTIEDQRPKTTGGSVVTGRTDDDDDELDRPSFLRRLKGFTKRETDGKHKGDPDD